MVEKYNVIGPSGIPINRIEFNDIIRALEFILRQEAEAKRLGIFEPGLFKVERIEIEEL